MDCTMQSCINETAENENLSEGNNDNTVMDCMMQSCNNETAEIENLSEANTAMDCEIQSLVQSDNQVTVNRTNESTQENLIDDNVNTVMDGEIQPHVQSDNQMTVNRTKETSQENPKGNDSIVICEIQSQVQSVNQVAFRSCTNETTQENLEDNDNTLADWKNRSEVENASTMERTDETIQENHEEHTESTAMDWKTQSQVESASALNHTNETTQGNFEGDNDSTAMDWKNQSQVESASALNRTNETTQGNFEDNDSTAMDWKNQSHVQRPSRSEASPENLENDNDDQPDLSCTMSSPSIDKITRDDIVPWEIRQYFSRPSLTDNHNESDENNGSTWKVKPYLPSSPLIHKYMIAYLERRAGKLRKKIVPKFGTSVMVLPETILLKIFSYLSQEDVCNAAVVCQEWRRVAYDSSLWREVDLRRFHTSLDESSLTRMIRSRMVPLLSKINLGGLNLTPKVFQVLAAECPKLKILSLESVTFLEKFSSKHKSFPSNLKTLDIRHSVGDTSAFMSISKSLSGINDLGISDQFLSSLLQKNKLNDVLKSLRELKVLEFSYCTALTDAMLGLFLSKTSKLESLCLRRCNNIHGHTLSLLLSSCPHLTSLVLDGTAITDSALKNTDWTMSTITELDLSWCRHLSPEGLKHILTRLPKLRYLRLCCVGYGHGVTDEVLNSMSDVGAYNDLQVVDASYSSLITDEGLRRFIEVCRGLLYLRINHCRATTPNLVELVAPESKVFIVANFPIASEVSFDRQLLKYTYWPTPIFMRNYGLDVEMGWN